MDEKIEKLVEKYAPTMLALDWDEGTELERQLRSALREAQRMAYEDAAKRALAWEAPPTTSDWDALNEKGYYLTRA